LIFIIIIIIIFSNITISKDDVNFIVDECEITTTAAEFLLRKNDGNLQKALTSFVRGES